MNFWSDASRIPKQEPDTCNRNPNPYPKPEKTYFEGS